MKKKQIDKRNNKGKNKRKKGKGIGKKILIIVALLLVIAGAWFAYRTYKNGGGLSGMLATMVGHDANTKKNLDEIKVLVLGVSTDIDTDLTDTIMVASYNPNTQKANLLSIPRDTYTGKNPKRATASQKINSLYNKDKDPKDIIDAVNELTGLDLKYYVIIRTEALIELVDAIGGVEFDVPIDMEYDDPTQDLHIDLKAGLQKLDGEKAEQLLRWRHSNYEHGKMTTYPSEYGSNDFGRMRTQRDFIVATLKQTLKPGNIFKLGEILDIAQKNVETNLDFGYVKDYIPYAVEFNTDNIMTATLPGTTPDISETNNVSIYIVDEDETEQLIQSMFYSNNTTEGEDGNTIANNTATNNNTTNSTTSDTTSTSMEKVKIELLNGSGSKSKLKEAEELLEQAGFNVTKTGNTSTISKTIITNKKSVDESKLQEMKTALGTGSITTSKSSTSLVDVTIIIGKDF